MRVITSCIVAAGLLLAGSGTALADTSTGSGPITENSHHHEFTNCGGSGLVNLANCVDLADL
jgi:hypothetical protein